MFDPWIQLLGMIMYLILKCCPFLNKNGGW